MTQAGPAQNAVSPKTTTMATKMIWIMCAMGLLGLQRAAAVRLPAIISDGVVLRAEQSYIFGSVPHASQVAMARLEEEEEEEEEE